MPDKTTGSFAAHAKDAQWVKEEWHSDKALIG